MLISYIHWSITETYQLYFEFAYLHAKSREQSTTFFKLDLREFFFTRSESCMVEFALIVYLELKFFYLSRPSEPFLYLHMQLLTFVRSDAQVVVAAWYIITCHVDTLFLLAATQQNTSTVVVISRKASGDLSWFTFYSVGSESHTIYQFYHSFPLGCDESNKEKICFFAMES